MKTKNNQALWVLLDVVSLFVIAVSIFIFMICCNFPEKSSADVPVDLISGWKNAEGEALSLNGLPQGDIVLKRSLNGLDIAGRHLCMKSTDTDFEIFADGISVYSYAPVQPSFIGASYGRYIHMVSLPEGTEEITISLRSLFSESSPNIPEIKLMDSGDYMRELYKSGLPTLCICFLLIVFGICMLIIGIASKDIGENRPLNFFSIGMLAILVSLWAVNDTYIIQALTQLPAMVKLITYLSLIFIAYPPVSFIAGITNQRETVLLPILMAFIGINFLLTILLSTLEISDLHYMLNVSHGIIIAAICMAVVLVIRAIRKKTVQRKTIRMLLMGMIIVVIGVIIDLIRYKLIAYSGASSGPFTLISVLIFISIIAWYLMKERNRLAIEHSRAELLAKIAYTDGLTGLNNRASFHKKEKELCSNGAACIIVQLDINNLKKVNDEYGHSEGDKHIVSAAHIIKDSFSAIGECYRTGGDEFIAVVEGEDTDEIEKALENMQKKAEAYNSSERPPVNLQIAFGYAKCSPHENALDAAERLADERMYICKRNMKKVGFST